MAERLWSELIEAIMVDDKTATKLFEAMDGLKQHLEDEDFAGRVAKKIEQTVCAKNHQPSTILKSFAADPSLKVAIWAVGLIMASSLGWLGYTWDLADTNTKAIVEFKSTVRQIKRIDTSVMAQGQKLDRMWRVLRKKRHGTAP